MNSRQYEAMRIAEHEAKKNKASVIAQNKLIRHLKRKSENELADNYFDYQFESVKEVKSMIKAAGWTWKEAQDCKHRHLDCFLNPTINVWLDSTQRKRYKSMFKKELPFMFMRGPLEKVVWYPTLDDVVDFVEESAILFKDPDHVGLTEIQFSKEKFLEKDGTEVHFYIVTFSLDS